MAHQLPLQYIYIWYPLEVYNELNSIHFEKCSHRPHGFFKKWNLQFSSVQLLSHVQLFGTLWTAERQASLSITNSSNSCPLSRWCHPTISSSVVPFSSHLQSFPASGSFQMSQLFASGGQSIGASASASELPMNTQGWFPLGLIGLILLSKGLSRVFSSTTVRKHQFLGS